MARSRHGLDDKVSIGNNGYEISSTGEVFLGNNWPTQAVWNQVWGCCYEDHADGTFGTDVISRASVSLDADSAGVGGLQQVWREVKSKVIVEVRGNYGAHLKGWGVRDDFMHDLLRHHDGDGGVWSVHAAHMWDDMYHPMEGWWAAEFTTIRHFDDFWVDIKLKFVDC